MPRRLSLLIVAATAPEAQYFQDLPAQPGQQVRVVVSGVGAVAAALTAWRVLAGQPRERPFDVVVSAGIGGAYPGSGLYPGDLAVSSKIIQADVGAQDGETFLGLDALGLSLLPTRPHNAHFAVWGGAEALALQLGAGFGPLLSLNTVTGTTQRAARLTQRYPGALAEGMEGAGVAHTALLSGVPVLEVRGISNPVGPRDRAGWRIGEALAATRRGLEALVLGDRG